MQIRKLVTYSFLALATGAASAIADETIANGANYAYELLTENILQSVVQTGYGDYVTGEAIGKKNPYRERSKQKVLAACIGWQNATPRSIPVMHWNSVYNRRSLLHAQEEALAVCRSKGTANCDCQIVDENDQNVLQVPPIYLAKLNLRASSASVVDAQPITRPLSLKYKPIGPVGFVYEADISSDEEKLNEHYQVKGTYIVWETKTALNAKVTVASVSLGESSKPIDISAAGEISSFGHPLSSNLDFSGSQSPQSDDLAKGLFQQLIPKWPATGVTTSRETFKGVPLASVLSASDLEEYSAFKDVSLDIDFRVIGRGVFENRDVVLVEVATVGKKDDLSLRCDADVKIDVATAGIAALVRKCTYGKKSADASLSRQLTTVEKLVTRPALQANITETLKAPQVRRTEKQIPIALSWDGVGDLLPGQLTYIQGVASSPIEVSLPLLGERCTGQMKLSDLKGSGAASRFGV